MDYILCLAKQATEDYVASCQLKERGKVLKAKLLLICVAVLALSALAWLGRPSSTMQIWRDTFARCFKNDAADKKKDARKKGERRLYR